MRHRPCAILLILGLVAGCGSDPGPTVMRIVGASPGLLEVTSWNLDGQRDGDRTRAVAQFTLAGGSRLELELLIAYDPTPVLAGGRWVSGDESGSVTAERVRFVGGQGEGPSVGGDYVLADERNLPRYRVQLPLTPIARPAPRP